MTAYVRMIRGLAERIASPPKSALPKAAQSKRSLFFEVLTLRGSARLGLLALGLLFATFGLVVPITQKLAIDTILSGKDDELIRAVGLFGIGFLALVLTRGIELVVRGIGMREAVTIETWLSREIYQKALNIKTEHRRDRTVGETVALVASHLSMVSFFLTDLFPAFFTAFIPIIVAPFMLGFYFDLSPIPVFSVVLFGLFGCFLFARNSSALFQRFKIQDEVRLGAVNEWIRNIKALRILGWMESFETKVRRRTHEATTSRVQVVKWSQLMNSFAESIPLILNVVGILTLLFTRPEPPTPGEIFGILWVLAVFLAIPMRTLPWVFVISLDARTSLQRIEDFLRKPEDFEPLAPDQAQIDRLLATNHAEAIVVEGLSLDLSGSPILRDVSFRVQDGEFVAIVGDVGSGKTQLLHALLREVPARFHSYRMYGMDVNQMSRQELRSFFAIAPQDSFTIAASVHENVGFDFNPHPSPETLRRVEHSLDLVEYGPDLQLLPDGIDTELGERGVNLSGGQKQRLGLARAHFSKRRVMLLDDAVSALDADTEERILRRLFLDAWVGKTRLLVTHRLTVLPKVDRILFMQQGRLIGNGSFEELSALPAFQSFVSSLVEGDDEST